MKRALLTAGLFLTVISACLATVPVGGYVDIDTYPPDAYIATATPMYFEGRAAYWWGGRWVFRDAGRWHAYREEPSHLREARVREAPAPHFYGRAHSGGFRHR